MISCLHCTLLRYISSNFRYSFLTIKYYCMTVPGTCYIQTILNSALINSETLMEESAKFERTCNDIKKKEKRPLLWKLRKAVRTVNLLFRSFLSNFN